MLMRCDRFRPLNYSGVRGVMGLYPDLTDLYKCLISLVSDSTTKQERGPAIWNLGVYRGHISGILMMPLVHTWFTVTER